MPAKKRRTRRPPSAGTRPNAPSRQAAVSDAEPAEAGWRRLLGFGIIAAVLAAGIVLAFIIHPSHGAASPPQPTALPVAAGQAIDGVPCDNNDANYHEHAHLTILEAGHHITIPANTGLVGSSCLYWMHTHDTTGEIHLEAPHNTDFKLGTFFDIWGQPLSRTDVAGARVKAGQSLRIWVNFRRYSGNPRVIRLRRHTQVTIEIGPPFPKPVPFNFNGD